MKFNPQRSIYLLFALLILILIRCKNDTFHDTIRFIETNKIEYAIGDTIDLMINIETLDKEKTIRIYDNYKNTSISFALVNSQIKVLNEEWSQSSEEFLPNSKIIEINITPGHPFTKSFKGLLFYEKDSVKIQFTELNLNVKYSKERLIRDSLRIHGFCRPINPDLADPMEDYFEPKDIKINIPIEN